MTKFTQDDDALLAELGVEAKPKKSNKRTARDERIIAGFEEIQRYFEENERTPQHGENRDIFERIYAVRLDRIRELEECRTLLQPLDHQGLLTPPGKTVSADIDELDDDALLAELGVEPEAVEITELRHVRPSAEKRAAEEIATRQPCEEFNEFKPLFEQAKLELEAGVRVSDIIRKDIGFVKTDIRKGEFFILGGQTLYVAKVGDVFKAPNGEMDARLRVIYSNGTESDLLLRSLQRALYKDETSRKISAPNDGPLFSGVRDDDDMASGTVYVLRSKSDHPVVAKNREVLHKIGITSGKVEQRVANAKLEPTYLMADVEIVTTYQLFNINRTKLENLIHRIFDAARLNIEIQDRFGNPVRPREWFLVPLFVIDEAIEKIKDGTISDYVYDPKEACWKRAC